MMQETKLKAIDFFCGAGGMSYGLKQSGIDVLGGIDIDEDCRYTYEINLSGSKYLQKDITSLEPTEVLREFGIRTRQDNLIFCGCSPCQFWSKIITDKRRSLRSAFLLHHFERLINDLRPGYIIVENVPGLKTNRHISILPGFLENLSAMGYSYDDGIIDASHYGVPQHRIRYLLIATRLHSNIRLPLPKSKQPPTVAKYIANLPPIAAGATDAKDTFHRAASLSETNLSRLAATPHNGGTRRSWSNNAKLQISAYEGKDDIFRDVYGRMHWDRPAPTITTRFNSISNGRFAHPEQNRAISLREGSLLQTFPKKFEFFGTNQSSIARQIGNAVPPKLAKMIGAHIQKNFTNGNI